MPARRTNPPPHDRFNAEGIQVKNAEGTVWFAKGDGSLAGSPEDTVKTPGSGSWRPIEEGAKDPKVFEAVWTETMTGSGRVFYDLVKGYVGKAGGLAGSIIKMKALRAWEGAKRNVRGAIDTVKEAGAAALEKAKAAGSSVTGWIGERWDDAKTAGGNACDAVRTWGSERIEQVKKLGTDTAQWIGDAYDVAKQWGAEKVDQLAQGVDTLKNKASGAAKAVAEVLSIFQRAKRTLGGGSEPPVGDFETGEEPREKALV